ncbi:MAG: CPBP family intramembrane metalloprotease [Phycisphaerales bacterium]|nr:CPBP family intramembrane metalloprotease [Phycisphaerales bacterium]
MNYFDPLPAPPSPLTLPHVHTRAAVVQLLFVLFLGVLVPFGPGLLYSWFGPTDEAHSAGAAATRPAPTDEPDGASLEGDPVDAGDGDDEFPPMAATQPAGDRAAPPSFDPAETATRYIYLVIDKSVHLLLAGGLLAFLLMRRGLSPPSFGITGRNAAAQVGGGLASVLLIYYYMYLSIVVIVSIELLAGFGPGVEDDLKQRIKWLSAIPRMSHVQAALMMGLVAAHEEVVFRGLLMPYLRRLTGSWVAAVAISCGIFGVLHLDQGVIGAIQASGIGVVLAIVFIRTRSLLAVTIAHGVFNFVQFQFVAPAMLSLTENMIE